MKKLIMIQIIDKVYLINSVSICKSINSGSSKTREKTNLDKRVAFNLFLQKGHSILVNSFCLRRYFIFMLFWQQGHILRNF